MRLCRFEQDWTGHWGIVEGDVVYALEGDPYGVPDRGPAVGRLSALAAAAERPAREGGLRLLAPAAPGTIWSNGANYPSRCLERNVPPPAAPGFLWSPGTMICGTGTEIGIPEAETRSEYGAELGVVVRRDCRDVSVAAAADAILGYTALNNIWSKDPDRVAPERPMRVYDNHCPTGPLLVTGDELDWRNRRVRLWVDGALRQEDTTSSMRFSPAFLVSYLSRTVTIRQGDLLMTGTPGGVEGNRLRFGQTVEVEIDGIGRLRNHVTRVDDATPTFIVSVQTWIERGGADARRAAPGRRGAPAGPSGSRNNARDTGAAAPAAARRRS